MATLYKRGGKGNWVCAWYDHTGVRRNRSTHTTDKRAAERIAGKWEADSLLRKEGVIDPKLDRFANHNRTPLAAHVSGYIDHCQRAEQAPRAVLQKRRHLERLLAESGVSRLSGLTAAALETNLAAMKLEGKAARTINFRRQAAVAFVNWARKTGLVESNALSVVPKLDESRDRRRVRRPLTDDELARLLAVAAERGRAEWYLAAALAGLRKGDLMRLTWADVNFTDGTLTISNGKARRTDTLPMHPQLAAAMKALRDRSRAVPQARVFPATVTDATRLGDFLRAGIAREVIVRDDKGEPIMLGREGDKRSPLRPLTRIDPTDDEGRVADLHALRTTLGTNLARAGVAPQLAQRIMRHGDYRTTLKHYTVLGLTDTSRAMEVLPGVSRPASEAQRATGTDGRAEAPDHPDEKRQRARQQLQRAEGDQGATPRTGPTASGETGDDRKCLESRPLRAAVRHGASSATKAGDATRTRNIQLGRLTLYH